MSAFPPISYSSLIGDRLAGLKDELAGECERLAKEREKSLREEIELLRKDNLQLRSRLGADGGAFDDAKVGIDISKGKYVVPIDGEESTQEPIPVSETSEIAPLAISEVHVDKPVIEDFQLAPELVKDNFANHRSGSHDGAYMDRDEHLAEVIGKCILDPSSDIKLCWDIFGIPVLAWDLITIPLQVFDYGDIGNEVMNGAGWVTLIYWTIDMPVTFITAIFDKEGEIIRDHKRIAKAYLKKAFWFDLLIIGGDWFSTIMELVGSESGPLSNIAVLRVLRISRFARLMRLRKLKSKIQTLEDHIDNEWVLVIMNLCSKVMSILVVNHYLCCGWYWVGTTSWINDDPINRWVTALPYPQYGPNRVTISQASWHYQYLSSLHWAVAQFTPGPQNIQPQNDWERVYGIFILLFGLIVFSSFIASVTQARMQLNKMMSKFERDNWLLRKFCRQNNVSRPLVTHMKRYIDLVIIPNYRKLTMNDVILLPKLSPHLRAQLTTELVSQKLIVHPLMRTLQSMNRAVMHGICNSASESLSLARSDVAFSEGQVAESMVIVTAGVLDYIPMEEESHEEKVEPGHWCCEAVLWTKWVHQGQLQASVESTVVRIHGATFRGILKNYGFVLKFCRQYGSTFCARLNDALRKKGHPSDLHEWIAWDCVGMKPDQEHSHSAWQSLFGGSSNRTSRTIQPPKGNGRE